MNAPFEPDEVELLERAASGDEDALAQLYERHGRRAYALALRVVRNPTLAEDAVQEAFLDLWRTAHRFDAATGAVSTWLSVLVHRRAVDAVRRETVRARPLLLSEPQTAQAAEDDCVDADERARVREALELLPVEQRQLLELAYWGGFTQRQLAERLETPLGTVKSRMFAALATLRDVLGDGSFGAASRVELAARAE